MSEHDWTAAPLLNSAFCGICYAQAASPAGRGECAGVPSRDPNSIFFLIEQAIVDHFDVAIPSAKTFQQAGEWNVEFGGRTFSISTMAITIADCMGDAA